MKKSGFVQVAFDFLILIHILDWKDVVIKYEVNCFHGVWLGIIVDATMVVQGREPLIIPRCLFNLDYWGSISGVDGSSKYTKKEATRSESLVGGQGIKGVTAKEMH